MEFKFKKYNGSGRKFKQDVCNRWIGKEFLKIVSKGKSQRKIHRLIIWKYLHDRKHCKQSWKTKSTWFYNERGITKEVYEISKDTVDTPGEKLKNTNGQ